MTHATAKISNGQESDRTATPEELLEATLLSDRDDFVIDLRSTGRTESYLRHSSGSSISGTKALRCARRTIDLAFSALALIVLFPLLIGLATTSKITSRGRALYSQERVGRGGRIFRCYKFRTMYPDADERLAALLRSDAEFRINWLRDQKVDRDPRVTPIGRLLRKTSLDELPQLANVFKGDMSIVGPRPIVPSETVRYGMAMPTVLSVRPGITGLWQVSGRNNLPYPERVALDLRYVELQSLSLDAKIIAKTLSAVATGDGAS